MKTDLPVGTRMSLEAQNKKLREQNKKLREGMKQLGKVKQLLLDYRDQPNCGEYFLDLAWKERAEEAIKILRAVQRFASAHG